MAVSDTSTLYIVRSLRFATIGLLNRAEFRVSNIRSTGIYGKYSGWLSIVVIPLE